MRKENWTAYLTFSKKDRNAAIVLLILIVLFFIVPFFYHPFDDTVDVKINTLDQELAKHPPDLINIAEEQNGYIPTNETVVTNASAGELFQFDPNTLDAAGYNKLGLQEKTINTILKYRSKGGHFWKADDIRKIYSLRKEDADRLIPYIKITGQQANLTIEHKQAIDYSKHLPVAIDINTATVEEWKALPAIGDVLANRIVKFRNKVGSFNSVVQVKQTYGLSDSAFRAIEPYLKITAVSPNSDLMSVQKENALEKININTATLNQLKSNPHIPEAVAQAIIIYRSQHGNFSTVEDIKKIVFINAEMYNQVAPFLKVN